VLGVQVFEPHWFAPLPPQSWPGAVHLPQSICPPQPSGMKPQLALCAAQVVFVQGGGTHAGGLPWQT